MIYSPKRILTPLKRVDFDPEGERNTQNRGISGYEPISWDEALDIVADEIIRDEARGRPRLRSSPPAAPTTCGATWATATAPTSAS